MKRPKELLFARHEGIVPKLNDIRRGVISGLDQAGKETERGRKNWFYEFWMEVVWPCRQVWTTIASIWVLLLIVNVLQDGDSPALIAKSKQASEMMLVLQLEERKLNDLLAGRSPLTEANPTKLGSPKPRSEKSGIVTG